MNKNEQSIFKSNPGSMLQIFLELNVIEQIKQIQKNENLKDEREVIIRAIQNYSKNNMDYTNLKVHGAMFRNDSSPTTFDGNIDMEKLENLFAQITSENLIKKLPQHEIYGISGAAMIARFQTKILPVKFSLLCLSKMIIEQESPWIDLNQLKQYTLDSAKIFIKKFGSSSIRDKLKVSGGFPIFKQSELRTNEDSLLVYARSCKRFQEQFVGRKLHPKELQMNDGVGVGGALVEMGLIEAKSEISDDVHNCEKISVTLSPSGKEFVSYKNNLIGFIYNDKENEPSSIFSQQEAEFYFKKILPKFKFENDFVEYLMKNKQIEHTRNIKKWFTDKFTNFCKSEFSIKDVSLQENTVRIYSNNIMSRLMEFGVFIKEPTRKSGPYTLMQDLSDLR